MRLGQTSLLTFLSRLGSSVIGFVATVYFAQVLGSEVLGVYFLTLASVSWLKLGTSIGIPLAITKRVSEQSEKGSYVLAGFILMASGLLFISVLVFVFRDPVNEYLGEPLYQLVILLLVAEVMYKFVGAVIKGERLVHVEGFLSVSQTICRVSVQVAALLLGFTVSGLLFGEIIGFIFVTVAGVILMIFVFDRNLPTAFPEPRHFLSIIDFAKFSWLDDLKGNTFNMMDTIVLGFFVPSGLIGVYVVCWNISAVLDMFSKSVRNVFFPEMSKLASEDKKDRIVGYLSDALAFSGLFIIPGCIGAIIVGRGLLNLYGTEFMQGYLILIILIGSTLCFSYQRQFLATMDALNRPDLSFRVNLFFTIANMGLNVGLVYSFGWYGAAVATFLSALCSLILSYIIMRTLLPFVFPYLEITRQLLAALVMGGLVYTLLEVMSSFGLDIIRFGPVSIAIGFGGVTYFTSLYVISPRFRTVLNDNIPLRIPFADAKER